MDMAAMASVLASSGARKEAQQLLNQLRTMMKQRYVCPYETAAIYVGLGKKNEAFQWLEKGYESRESCMVYLKTDPIQNSFRMLDRKVTQEAAAVFPEFEVGCLDQVLHEGSRLLAPQGCRAHNGEADRPSHPGNELFPCLVITRPGAETDDVFQ